VRRLDASFLCVVVDMIILGRMAYFIGLIDGQWYDWSGLRKDVKLTEQKSEGYAMLSNSTLTPRQLVIVGISIALAVVIIAFMIGRASAVSNINHTITPVPTRINPTSTPNLTIRSPHILATWQSPINYPCEGCWQFTFNSNGPFDILTICNPYQVFAGSLPSFEVHLFDGNGHQIDTVNKACGDPNQNVIITGSIPEAQAAGQYLIKVVETTTAPITILILDASSM